MLEELERAVARGASIYAEVVGYGLTSDAFHMTAQPEDGDGAVRAMRMALDKAGVAPEQVDYINAHGTSTPINDPTETLAVKRLFGEHAYKPGDLVHQVDARSSSGRRRRARGRDHRPRPEASGRAADDQSRPPRSERCDLDYVPHVKREMKVSYALSNSFGFGGTNAALLFRRADAA